MAQASLHRLLFAQSLLCRIAFALCVIALSLSSCDDVGGVPPGIRLGVSIDGVRLGYSRAQVERLLGSPTSIGWADGADRASIECEYYPRVVPFAAVMEVSYIETLSDDYGPVDGITVGPGYHGKTEVGLGIGSRRSDVERMLGLPMNRYTDTSRTHISDWYCCQKQSMLFDFYADTLTYIYLGPFVPSTWAPKCN
jgi:hypothetical protein